MVITRLKRERSLVIEKKAIQLRNELSQSTYNPTPECTPMELLKWKTNEEKSLNALIENH